MSEAPSDPSVKNKCPNCGEVVELSAHLIGKPIECPNAQCDQVFRVAPATGQPVEADDAGVTQGHEEPLRPISDESLLFVVHPAMVRQRPFRALVAAIIGLAGLAALILGALGQLGWRDELPVPLAAGVLLAGGAAVTVAVGLVFLWWWAVKMFTKVIVTNKRVTYRVGIVSRETSEVQHKDVRNLQIDQGIVERLFNVGDIAISSSGQDDLEIVAEGIPDPDRVAAVVRKYQ
jgi:hypothetical protein